MRIFRLTLAVVLALTVIALSGCTKEPPVNPRLQPAIDPTAASMPVLTDLSLGRAMARIEDAGLELRLIKWTEQSDLDPGTVVSQEPEPGATLPKGASVTLVVAGAPGDIEVPDVVGMTVARARQALAKAALVPTVNSNTEVDPSVVKIVEQNPPAGSSVPVGTRVEIITP